MSNDDHIRTIKRRKTGTSGHPYAAIDHRVIDSAAFADLRPSSVRLLLIISRQLTIDNNGHLQATWSYCKQRGIGSENTLRDAIRDLIAHGFIYRSKSRGANKVWAKYAVTWRGISRSKDLYLDGFQKDGWKYWEKKHPQETEVNDQQKMRLRSRFPAETDGSCPSETEGYEFVPCMDVNRDQIHANDSALI